VLIASAYFGGGRADRITAMAVDAAGYVYLAGATESTDFPSPSIRAISAGVEAYVLKIHPTTFQVVYATYLGGMGDDRALAIAVDSSGSAYVAGVTASYDFPAVPWSGGSSDGFLVRLNSSGALLFGRMLGGGGADSANAVALTADGSAWVAGETTSADLTLTGVPYQGVYRGGSDVMLAKVNSSGAVTSMGYFGGSGDDRATAAAVDGSGEVYFTGSTTSAQFFPVASAYSGYKGGQDAFIAKLSGDGRTLRYSTYLGGTGGVPGQARPATGSASTPQAPQTRWH
jgi:hypothetical protein